MERATFVSKDEIARYLAETFIDKKYLSMLNNINESNDFFSFAVRSTIDGSITKSTETLHTKITDLSKAIAKYLQEEKPNHELMALMNIQSNEDKRAIAALVKFIFLLDDKRINLSITPEEGSVEERLIMVDNLGDEIRDIIKKLNTTAVTTEEVNFINEIAKDKAIIRQINAIYAKATGTEVPYEDLIAEKEKLPDIYLSLAKKTFSKILFSMVSKKIV